MLGIMFLSITLTPIMLPPIATIKWIHPKAKVAYDTKHVQVMHTRVPILEGIATEWKCPSVDEAQRNKIAYGDQGIATTQKIPHLVASAPESSLSWKTTV